MKVAIRRRRLAATTIRTRDSLARPSEMTGRYESTP
jgi:hypothetical protein